MSDNSEQKLKQTQMGNYFTRQSKAKEKGEKDDTPKNFIDRRNRFKDRSDDWNTAGWSTGWSSTSNWFSTDWKKKDTEDYRNEYPGKKDHPNQSENLKFYMNEISSYPDGDYIDNIHKKWWGNYMFLERHHGYIQWLFPIRESGMNFHAQELQLHEAKKIKENPKAHRRVLKSYMMMLDFYGMKIKDEDTGELEKNKNWKERFNHLNRSYHNYLRITRILKCLGELGYEHIKVKFLEFIIEEALEKKTLKNCYKSCKDYWVETLRNDGERKYIQDYMKKVEEGYESDGDPLEDYKTYFGQSEDVNMDDESQEMKYYDAEKGSEEEKTNLSTQMSVESTQNDEKIPDKTATPDTLVTEEKNKQDREIVEMDSKSSDSPEKQTDKDSKADDNISQRMTRSQVTQPVNLENV